MLRCTSCGCYRIDPAPIQRDAESAAFYTDYYAGPNVVPSPGTGAPRRTSRFWQVVEQVPRLAAPGRVALDVGCGEGHLCAQLAAAGWERVIGIDVSSSRIARARQRYPGIAFYDRPIGDIGIPHGSVDLIVMDNVLEHLPDPPGMLRELYPYLTPGGTLVLITPNMESGSFRLLGRYWTPELAPHAHVYLFTPSAITRLVLHAGYALDARGTFHFPLRGWRQWIESLRAADPRQFLWRAAQEAGEVFGRLIGSGSMLYVVVQRPARAIERPHGGD
ncbi:MAG TPA: class I SAM-dependent methyltransferase [Gemmatimonadaceae bacterium]